MHDEGEVQCFAEILSQKMRRIAAKKQEARQARNETTVNRE